MGLVWAEESEYFWSSDDGTFLGVHFNNGEACDHPKGTGGWARCVSTVP